MAEYLPLIIVGAIIGAFTLVFCFASLALKKAKEEDDSDRHMKDSEIVGRLLGYAKPYWKSFIVVFIVMLFSITFELVSPLIISHIQDIIKGEFVGMDLIIREGHLFSDVFVLNIVVPISVY